MEQSVPLGVPASRQKSCDACAKGKRRCDKSYPVCGLCARKGLTCVYPRRRTWARSGGGLGAASSSEFGSGPLGESLIDSLNSAATSSSMMETDFNFFDLMGEEPKAMMPSPIRGMVNPDIDLVPVPDLLMSVLEEEDQANPESWLVRQDQGPVVQRAGATELESRQGEEAEEEVIPLDHYSKMDDICDAYEPWQLYDPTTTIHFIIQTFKSLPSIFANTSATPFSHHRLYSALMPPSIVAAFSTCTAYAAGNATNRVAFLRTLRPNISELLREIGASTTVTQLDRLAHTQALLFYQVIRVFDGDVTLRAEAERDMELLEIALGGLCKVRENLGDLSELDDSGVKARPPREWEHWIFAESVRRTIILAYIFVGLYEMLKNPDHSVHPDPWTSVHRWTMSKHLWEAESSFDFYSRWRNKPHFIIKNFAFDRFLQTGKGEDVDSFGRIILTLYLGLDDTKQFYSDTGSTS